MRPQIIKQPTDDWVEDARYHSNQTATLDPDQVFGSQILDTRNPTPKIDVSASMLRLDTAKIATAKDFNASE